MPSRRFARTSPGTALSQRLERFPGTPERLELELGVSDKAQPLRFPFESLRFLGQQPQVAALATALRQLDVLLEIDRHRHQHRAVMRLEFRKQLENGAVPVLGIGVERRAQRRGERFHSPARFA